MGIGTGVAAVAAGAILYWAVDADLPYVDDHALAAILMVAGVIAIIAASVVNAHRSQTGAGTGLGLAVVGAILYWAVDIDVPFLFDGALAVILMFAGVIAVIAAMVMDWQRSRSRHVVEHRYSEGSSGHR